MAHIFRKDFEKTNYDWYLKNRPNHPGKFKIYQPHTNRVLKLFVKKFNKIKMLPNNYLIIK